MNIENGKLIVGIIATIIYAVFGVLLWISKPMKEYVVTRNSKLLKSLNSAFDNDDSTDSSNESDNDDTSTHNVYRRSNKHKSYIINTIISIILSLVLTWCNIYITYIENELLYSAVLGTLLSLFFINDCYLISIKTAYFMNTKKQRNKLGRNVVIFQAATLALTLIIFNLHNNRDINLKTNFEYNDFGFILLIIYVIIMNILFMQFLYYTTIFIFKKRKSIIFGISFFNINFKILCFNIILYFIKNILNIKSQNIS